MARPNREILTGGKKYAQKRKQANRVEEVVFDKDSRVQYLTGFHKRKLQRKKKAQEYNQEQERKARLEERQRIREERRQQVQKRLQELNEALKIQGSEDEESEESEQEEDKEEQWTGFDSQRSESDEESNAEGGKKGILKQKYEVDDADAPIPGVSTVEVEAIENPNQIDLMELARKNRVDLQKAEEVLEQSIERAKKYARLVGADEKPKKKKKKFRYLSKEDPDPSSEDLEDLENEVACLVDVQRAQNCSHPGVLLAREQIWVQQPVDPDEPQLEVDEDGEVVERGGVHELVAQQRQTALTRQESHEHLEVPVVMHVPEERVGRVYEHGKIPDPQTSHIGPDENICKQGQERGRVLDGVHQMLLISAPALFIFVQTLLEPDQGRIHREQDVEVVYLQVVLCELLFDVRRRQRLVAKSQSCHIYQKVDEHLGVRRKRISQQNIVISVRNVDVSDAYATRGFDKPFPFW
ncbi:hypothetical protein KL921_000304 [Ogataea angusta]|nr:hypothetical protein KL921_000304 [Ogataea angusta]